MNWLKVYKKIVINGQTRERIDMVYYEKHHIIPKSLFTSDFAKTRLDFISIEKVNDKKNFTYLTLREHFFCHVILCSIFNDNKNCLIKMLFAFKLMSNRTSNNNTREYERLRKDFSKAASERLIGKPSRSKDCKWSEEAKKNLGDLTKGKSYSERYGKKLGDRLKKERGQVSKNRIASEETKKKLSEREITEEWKAKISLANKGKKRTQVQRDKMKIFSSNSFLNASVDQTYYLFENKRQAKFLIGRKIDIKAKDLKIDMLRLIRNSSLTSRNGWNCRGIKILSKEQKITLIKEDKTLYRDYLKYLDYKGVENGKSNDN